MKQGRLETWINELKASVEKYGIKKIVDIIPGGKTGYQSIHNGLLRIEQFAELNDIVLICDGVRPVLSEQLITTCITDAAIYETAVPVTPSIDSVLYSEDGVKCSQNLVRKKNIYYTSAAGIYA